MKRKKERKTKRISRTYTAHEEVNGSLSCDRRVGRRRYVEQLALKKVKRPIVSMNCEEIKGSNFFKLFFFLSRNDLSIESANYFGSTKLNRCRVHGMKYIYLAATAVFPTLALPSKTRR